MVVSLALWIPCAAADVLVVGSKHHRGQFAGFRDGGFFFTNEAGETTKYTRSAVNSLTLETPCEVRMFRVNKAAEETAVLQGYKRGNFALDMDGAQRQLPGLHVKSMETARSADPAAGGSDAPRVRAAIDISALENAPSLTPQQKEALDRYRQARRAYEAFVAASTAAVEEMNKATGALREALLNDLRQRKGEEQPITQELRAAEKALWDAFPRPAKDTRDGAVGQGQAPGGAVRRATVPALPEEKVVVLDLRELERMPDLSREQSEALRRQAAARGEYLRLVNLAPDVVKPEEISVAIKTLKEAQNSVFTSFPDVKFETGGANP
jgi:hypothetical protein